MFFGGRKGSKQGMEQDKVITMERFQNRLSLSPMKQAEAYWTALRRGDDIPSRAQVDPRGLENILSQTFIVERIAPGIARFRLAGQKVNEMAGMEVRGMPLSAFFTPEARKELSAAMEHMFDTPSVIQLSLKTEGSRIKGSREAHILLMPLRSDLGDVSRALGVFVSAGNETGTSQRFSINNIEIRAVLAAGSKDRAAFKAKDRKPADAPEKATDKPHVNAPNPGFAETQARFRREPSIMEEARSLLNRHKGAKNTTRPADTSHTNSAEPKAVAKTAKERAPHLRLVVSRD